MMKHMHLKRQACSGVAAHEQTSPNATGPPEDDADSDSEEEPEDERSEREQIKKDLIMGHLLTLATSEGGSGLPQHALPTIAAALAARDLLPRWVHWALTQQPQLFDRALARLFSVVSHCASCSPVCSVYVSACKLLGLQGFVCQWEGSLNRPCCSCLTCLSGPEHVLRHSVNILNGVA